MAKAAKLADVARAAGVSQGTASNVFSRPEIVRAEVRQRVEDCARKLGYGGPDPKGRLLRAGKVNAIGVVVMDNLTYFFNDPFNREFMSGVSEVCDERGAGLALVSAVDRTEAAWNINSALVDGFIVQCIEDGDRLLELTRKRNLPFVAVDIDPGPDASAIMIDDRGGARMAAEHLLALGHRKIAVLALEIVCDGKTGPADRARREKAEVGATRDRLLGYEDALPGGRASTSTGVVVEFRTIAPARPRARAYPRPGARRHRRPGDVRRPGAGPDEGGAGPRDSRTRGSFHRRL